jgi:S-DNA-T family DNA segregation ATPase FtsK/SpoIIIE
VLIKRNFPILAKSQAVKERYINEIKGLIVLALSLIVLASIIPVISYTPYDLRLYTSAPNVPPHNLIRSFGAYLGGLLLLLFGLSAYIIPLVMFWVSINFFRQRAFDLRLPRIIAFLILLVSFSSILDMFGFDTKDLLGTSAGGVLGLLLSKFMITYFGRLGSYIISFTFAILSFSLLTQILLSATFLNLSLRIKKLFQPLFGFFANLKPVGNVFKKKKRATEVTVRPIIKNNHAVKETAAVLPPLLEETKVATKPKIQIKAAPEVKSRQVQIGDYHLPGLDLLESPPPLAERQIKEDLTANARILEETLADFGISVKVTDIERGPVITRYELEPAPGVKLNRIVSLSDDIALTMKAQSVRIVAPIPGKGRVGVEVPNMQSSLVYLQEVFSSEAFQKSESKLTLALGKDIAGTPVITDLSDMPHLLIAGTTGSGKTVCVNCLVLSMLFRALPNEVKFLMVDPKMVELAPFNGLPHLLCPVVTDVKKASAALNWVVNEMEERYRLLAKAGARNIEIYNQKQEKIPYIVVIVDELADLMFVARDSIESAITRLAQLSRAVGIHLILATQRPSVDVITGVIKANFPARISFKVASKVDSRTVLDMNGADKLLGRGDMLFMRPGESKLIRAQGSLVQDKEIERVVEFIRAQAEPVYDEEILKEESRSMLLEGGKDELYDDAVRVVMETGQASVSILQRRLRLGYTRAARIIDMMEQDGLVGSYEGSKPRHILIDREEWLKEKMTEGA